MRIFVGGLTEHLADITEQDLRSIFNFGDIDYIDLHKDPNTGKCQGYAFVQFRKASQARAAISAMHGFNYKGKILRVGEASEAIKNGNELFLPSGEYEDSNYLHNMQSKATLMQKLSRDTMGGQIIPSLPSMTTPNPMATPMIPGIYIFNYKGQPSIPPTSQSNCLLLANLFDPSSLNQKDNPDFSQEVYEDVYEECSSFGKVDKVWVDVQSQGNVWVKFSNNNYQAANMALEKLNGR